MSEDCARPHFFFAPFRAWGMVCVAAVIALSCVLEPRPGLSGNGPWVALGIAGFVCGVALTLRSRDKSAARKIVPLALTAASSVVLGIAQPDSAAVAGIYFTVLIAGVGLERVPALFVAGGAVAAEVVVLALRDDPGWQIFGFLISIIPWFLVMRLVRELRAGQARAERLVEELRESRAAHADAAAAAERGRVARDMHDVLAHSLSALAIQLEGARLMTRNRGADPEVVSAVERAHHLAAGGLAEARQAIGALHGDELPGPERLPALVDGFSEHSHVDARLTVTGEPGPQSSEARLALYRTAQEALTNIRKHSTADRVDVQLDYAPDGTRLTVHDHGAGAPVMVGAETARANGGGYGLTGMRERAELLGGTLSAEPTADGFCVELWLPA